MFNKYVKAQIYFYNYPELAHTRDTSPLLILSCESINFICIATYNIYGESDLKIIMIR